MVTIEENAMKLARVASFYPEHKLEEILGLIQMPPADINAALWRAEDLGYMEIDKKAQQFKLLHVPDMEWGELTSALRDRIMYCLKKLNESETDMEEMVLTQWFAGYPSHDILLVLKSLIQDEVVATYNILDSTKEGGKNEYVYYTLAKNRSQEWGRKQFKKPENLKVT